MNRRKILFSVLLLDAGSTIKAEQPEAAE